MTRKQNKMTDQFKAGRCPHAASTDNLVLIDNRQNGRPPGQPLDNSDGINIGIQAESRCKTPGAARGEMLALGID